MFSLPISPIDSPRLGAVVDVDMASVPQLDQTESAKQANATITSMDPTSDRMGRETWLSEGRGRKGLRIVIVTENFLPKVDGVTRTLARLLEHLEREGHSCMLLGPGSGMSHYATHPLVGTLGLPLIVYPGLKLNFLRPKFLSTIKNFQPDVVHFVDPIWLGAQTMMAMELGWAGEDWAGEGGSKLGGGITGAVVASYHTNLATYATLFGMPWLEPYMWRFQTWLYNKTILTLCPSPSTSAMLEGQKFNPVRLWPRGVELSQFNPGKRSAELRRQWGIVDPLKGTCPEGEAVMIGTRRTSLPITPPATPEVRAVDQLVNEALPGWDMAAESNTRGRLVAMYTGRISWEKNIHLLLRAFEHLAKYIPDETQVPKLVFVGDGPARQELDRLCVEKGIDAEFMGHRSGEDLATNYASADIFVFPSFTETFGQVVLEALASGLPVVGLDAEGTRDLVKHGVSGQLLPLPKDGSDSMNASRAWPRLCKVSSTPTPIFDALAHDYAKLIAQLVNDPEKARRMGEFACTKAIEGYTWWDAMEKCVDGYREAMRTAISRRAAKGGKDIRSSKLSGLRRPISSALAHRGGWETEAPRPVKFIQASFRIGLVLNALIFLVLYLLWRKLTGPEM